MLKGRQLKQNFPYAVINVVKQVDSLKAYEEQHKYRRCRKQVIRR